MTHFPDGQSLPFPITDDELAAHCAPTRSSVPEDYTCYWPEGFSDDEMYKQFKKKIMEVRSEPTFQAYPKEFVVDMEKKAKDGCYKIPSDLVVAYFVRTVLERPKEVDDLQYFKGRRYSFDEQRSATPFPGEGEDLK